MKKLVNCLVVVSLAALAAVVVAPAALADSVDYAAAFYVPESLQVGPTNLDAGVYVVRSVNSGSARNLLVVTNADGTKVLATLLVTPHQIAQQDIRGASRLLYDAADGTRPAALRTFLVANSSFGYDIVGSSAPARVAAVPTKELVAIAAAR
jgi:hypothetical protein